MSVSGGRPGWVCVRPGAYNDIVRQQMREVPGVAWDHHAKHYDVPLDVAGVLLRRLEQARIIKVKLREGVQLQEDVDDADQLTSKRALTAAKLTGAFKRLRPYQVDGVTFLVERLERQRTALLCDDAGVGKSAQVLGAWSLLDARSEHTLIVAPAVVVPHWRGQIAQWLDKPAKALSSKEAALAPGFNVVSYDTLRAIHSTGKAPQVSENDLVILDEVHYLANPKAKRSKAAAALLKHNPMVIGMTGTPITSRVHTLWNPLNIMFPGVFGTFYQFTARYCAGHYDSTSSPGMSFWVYDGSSNEDELAARLKRTMLRRSIDVLDLPPRNRITMPVEVPNHVLKQLLQEARYLAHDNDLRRILGEVEEHKLKAAVELGKSLVEQGRKVLLYTTRKSTAHALGKALNMGVATGDLPVGQRRETLMRSCASNGGGVATIYSITTGIDLADFDVGIFVGLDHVPATLLQAEGRIHRMGQHATVTFYYLIGLRTPDEVIRHRVIQRLGYYANIVGDFGSAASLSEALSERKSDDLSDLVQVVQRYAEAGGSAAWTFEELSD